MRPLWSHNNKANQPLTRPSPRWLCRCAAATLVQCVGCARVSGRVWCVSGCGGAVGLSRLCWWWCRLTGAVVACAPVRGRLVSPANAGLSCVSVSVVSVCCGVGGVGGGPVRGAGVRLGDPVCFPRWCGCGGAVGAVSPVLVVVGAVCRLSPRQRGAVALLCSASAGVLTQCVGVRGVGCRVSPPLGGVDLAPLACFDGVTEYIFRLLNTGNSDYVKC